jgi:hypothetical protein
MIVLNKQPAPGRARRDDPIALPSRAVFDGLFGPIRIPGARCDPI